MRMAYTFRPRDLPELDLRVEPGTDFSVWNAQWEAYMSLLGRDKEPETKQVQALTHLSAKHKRLPKTAYRDGKRCQRVQSCYPVDATKRESPNLSRLRCWLPPRRYTIMSSVQRDLPQMPKTRTFCQSLPSKARPSDHHYNPTHPQEPSVLNQWAKRDLHGPIYRPSERPTLLNQYQQSPSTSPLSTVQQTLTVYLIQGLTYQQQEHKHLDSLVSMLTISFLLESSSEQSMERK